MSENRVFATTSLRPAKASAEGRSSEWPEILAEVRESHRRKRRLMEVLDGLEGKPIVCRKRSRS